jgi:MoaA/NifB/PqqE/SkfB family radical SAM enzyme
MDGDNNRVGLDSAGCQVFQHRSDFDRFIKTIKKVPKAYGNKFTYTLINEDDIPALINNVANIAGSTYHVNLL